MTPKPDPHAARGYVGPVAHEITFDAQRDPMFQDDQGNGWVPLATYDERIDDLARVKDALSDLLVHIPNGGRWSVLRRYKEAGYAALR